LEVKEISLAIDTPDGIVLIVGCSHPTIEKIVEAAKNTINKPTHLVLGGTHLLPAKDDQINSIALSLRDNWGRRKRDSPTKKRWTKKICAPIAMPC
jgi:7,8-dihydropterin-6-yl-methyl-4-(beta-D-ribofuranosyl)aminobenzene 5'-phosphate synthase